MTLNQGTEPWGSHYDPRGHTHKRGNKMNKEKKFSKNSGIDYRIYTVPYIVLEYRDRGEWPQQILSHIPIPVCHILYMVIHFSN